MKNRSNINAISVSDYSPFGVELEGLEYVSFHNYAFAPFGDFGGGYHGDGENRRFGDKVNPVAKLSENFRIGSEVQEFLFFILFNEDGTFKGASLGNGNWFELKDWNKIFTDLDPKGQNVGTNIKYDEIQLDYDPD